MPRGKQTERVFFLSASGDLGGETMFGKSHPMSTTTCLGYSGKCIFNAFPFWCSFQRIRVCKRYITELVAPYTSQAIQNFSCTKLVFLLKLHLRIHSIVLHSVPTISDTGAIYSRDRTGFRFKIYLQREAA